MNNAPALATYDRFGDDSFETIAGRLPVSTIHPDLEWRNAA